MHPRGLRLGAVMKKLEQAGIHSTPALRVEKEHQAMSGQQPRSSNNRPVAVLLVLMRRDGSDGEGTQTTFSNGLGESLCPLLKDSPTGKRDKDLVKGRSNG